MDVFAKSSLGRPLYPSYKTNVAIMILTLLTGVVMGGVSLLQSGDFGLAIGAGLLYGAIVFVAWVITREIDPDHDLSAFLSVALSFGAALWLMPSTIALWPLGLVILGSRMLTRVVGIRATLIDSFIMVAVIGLTAYSGYIAVALAASAFFFLDAWLQEPLRRQWAFGALALAIIFLVALIANQGMGLVPASMPYILVIGVISLVFLLTILLTGQITTHSDFGNRPLSLSRLRAAMLMTLAIGLVQAVTNSDGGVLSMITLWASLAAVPLYRLIIRIGLIGE